MVSVIVPVYNVENYLVECIESILDQTFTDMEIILVDDGSTDQSGNICDEYKARYRNIKVIHQQKRGPGAARNAGLDVAKGEFVAFIDSDDVIAPYYIQVLHDAINQEGVDVACPLFAKSTHWPESIEPKAAVVENIDAIHLTLLQRVFNSSPCKMFRKRLFNYERFTEGILYEDLDIICRIYEHARKVAVVLEEIYYYRPTPKSIIHTFNPQRFDALKVTENIARRYSANAELRQAALIRQFAANFNMYILGNLADEEYKDTTDHCWQMVKSLRATALWYPHTRLKDRIGAIISYLGKSTALKIAKKFYS